MSSSTPVASPKDTGLLFTPKTAPKRPLRELISLFEQQPAQDTGSREKFFMITPIKNSADDSDKENSSKFPHVSDIVLKFKGNSVVKNRETFFRTLLERRNEDLKSTGHFNSHSHAEAVRSLPSPVKAELMRAWADAVAAAGAEPTSMGARSYLAELGIKEDTISGEEWTDWNEAIIEAEKHSHATFTPSPIISNSANGLSEAIAKEPTVATLLSPEAFSIAITPARPETAAKPDLSFDLDDVSSYADNIMSQYPTDKEIFARSESLDSICLTGDRQFICPEVRLSPNLRHSCDSSYKSESDGPNVRERKKPSGEADKSNPPRPCLSWFGCL